MDLEAGGMLIDPYEVLGLERSADEKAIRTAYRRLAKEAHPDSGGDEEQFARLQASYDLLKDPVRRKIFDDTGFDPELSDPKDLKGLMLLEPLVNEMILDDREPGSFDPVAAMRRKLSDDILKNRFHILELERHRTRVRKHLDRLARKKNKAGGSDVLGSMLRARTESISEAIHSAEQQIEFIEQAYTMLEGYAYELQSDDEADDGYSLEAPSGKAAE
ncbi:J domain-containing protein [Martelella alba]|uniref:J domain-containing protein n=1 Tax=Martelella alba TaxID=2590451 RepID=A0A506UIL0_9HYPH|nr:J domain-containing protein [Martelella alba]TPW33103.1 J domain-containing protein [Martelella alba]